MGVAGLEEMGLSSALFGVISTLHIHSPYPLSYITGCEQVKETLRVQEVLLLTRVSQISPRFPGEGQA